MESYLYVLTGYTNTGYQVTAGVFDNEDGVVAAAEELDQLFGPSVFKKIEIETFPTNQLLSPNPEDLDALGIKLL